MEKSIKDYLHLYHSLTGENGYLQVLTPRGIATMGCFTISNHIGCGMNPGYGEFLPEEVKPLLRPLSDMTKKEAKEWADLKEGAWNDMHLPMQGLGVLSHWLRSKHFDIDGLIEAGLAINKAKKITP